MHTGWLALTAFWIGLTHTLLGPDHYIPFVAMSRARGWSVRRTIVITVLCGIGHVGSSVLLGLIGLGGGILLRNLTDLEEVRGDWAAWLLIGFGLAYATWGIGRAIRGIPHPHLHGHVDGIWHAHEQSNASDHPHAPERALVAPFAMTSNSEGFPIAATSPEAGARRPAGELTPWVLFVIFLFGPCEPLIPLFIYPAAEHNYLAAVLVALVFGVATLATMTGCVLVLRHGVNAIHWRRLDRFSHSLAGLAILACGLAMKFGF